LALDSLKWMHGSVCHKTPSALVVLSATGSFSHFIPAWWQWEGLKQAGMEELLRIFSPSKATWTSTGRWKYVQFLEGRWSPGSGKGPARQVFSPRSL